VVSVILTPLVEQEFDVVMFPARSISNPGTRDCLVGFESLRQVVFVITIDFCLPLILGVIYALTRAKNSCVRFSAAFLSLKILLPSVNGHMNYLKSQPSDLYSA
jgi:hypothetical protein